ncbi:MAG: hypothetical protein WBC71_11450 [Salaquimonas sp.]
MAEHTSSNSPQVKAPEAPDAGNDKVSAAKVVLWVLLFQLAWNFRAIVPFFKEGSFIDPDDFLRLHQVRNWMAGQSWFDVSVPRMNLPDGGDMHWSRLVDVPIASLIWFFDLFVDTQSAERLAALVWPTLLLIATVFVLLAICEKVYPKTNRLLALIFIVTCSAAMVEFAPSRIDHHGIQILIYCVALLGLVKADENMGHYLIGASVALSIVIGLDGLLLMLFILCWLGFEWALGIDKYGTGLRKTAIAMTVTSLVFYPISVPPENWLRVLCDVNSILFLTALLAISAAFVVMSFATNTLSFESKIKTIAARLALGGLLAAGILALLYGLYPQCSLGPMSGISDELRVEWLSQIVEAKGLIAYVIENDSSWVGMPLYLIFVIGLGLYIIVKTPSHPRLLALWVTIVICLLLGFFQVRTYRIGIFAIVPICAILSQTAWYYFNARYSRSRPMALAATGLTCLLLISPTWIILGKMIMPANSAPTNEQPVEIVTRTLGPLPQSPIAGKNECSAQSEYVFLNTLPKGYILNAIDIGPSILVFTNHSVVGGNYHRNDQAILDTRRFFFGSEAEAIEIAERRNPDYIAFCWFPLPDALGKEDQAKFGVQLLQNKVPQWLKKVSGESETLIIFEYLQKK